MNMQWGSGGTAPCTILLALDGDEWSASCPSHFIPGKKPLVPSGWEAGWATEPHCLVLPPNTGYITLLISVYIYTVMFSW